jgi:uncharacterized protein (TIGR03083 family)
VVTPGPELTDTEVEELLGAYALDACEPDEIVAVEAVLARRPDLAVEAARLSRAATWIGATDALEPPTRLRGTVLERVRARPTRPTRPPGHFDDPVVELYREQSRRFEEAVDLVRDDALDEITANGLSARDLVVHEAAQESLLAQAVGDTPVPEVVETRIEARTAEFVELLASRPLDDALDLWRASVDANCAWATGGARGSAKWRGLELDRDDAIIVRAFETWIHTDDLRRVAGLDGLPPDPPHLSLMSDLAGRTLSMALGLVDRTRPGKTARLVLTGAGGGEWLVAMDGSGLGAGVPDVTVTADVVDWCLLVGDRTSPAAMAHAVEGDAGLAEDLLAAAPALATL